MKNLPLILVLCSLLSMGAAGAAYVHSTFVTWDQYREDIHQIRLDLEAIRKNLPPTQHPKNRVIKLKPFLTQLVLVA